MLQMCEINIEIAGFLKVQHFLLLSPGDFMTAYGM
jgi:hypothetical protein